MSRPTQRPTGVEEQTICYLLAGFLHVWLLAFPWRVLGYEGLSGAFTPTLLTSAATPH